MRDIWFVFLGGGLGSIVRFSLGRWVTSLHHYNFPFGTLVVNVVACFLLGLVVGLADHRQLISPAARLFWAAGFCGGFSTFSTFTHETLSLLQQGHSLSVFLYLALSVFLCVGATFGGLYAGESF